MKSNNVSLIGISHRLALGTEIRNFDLEVFYKKGAYGGDYKPDGTTRTLEAENKSYGANLAFYLGNRLNLNLGYAWNNNTYKVETLPVAALNGSLAPLGIHNDDGTIAGMSWGIGYDIFKSRFFDIFTKYTQYSWSDIKGDEHIIAIGLKFKARLNFDGFFSNRASSSDK